MNIFDLIKEYPILGNKNMALVKQSILSISDTDELQDDRAFMVDLFDNWSTDDKDDFYNEMLPCLMFIDEKDSIAYTTKDKIICLSYPCDSAVIPQDKDKFMRWYFVYCHECLHQLWDTFEVGEKIKNAGMTYNHKLLNIASDCVINDYLAYITKSHKKAPLLGIMPDTIKEKYGVEYNRKVDTQYTLYTKLLELTKDQQNEIEKEYGEDEFDGKITPKMVEQQDGSDDSNNSDGSQNEEYSDEYKKGYRQAIQDVLDKKTDPKKFKPLDVKSDYENGYNDAMKQIIEGIENGLKMSSSNNSSSSKSNGLPNIPWDIKNNNSSSQQAKDSAKEAQEAADKAKEAAKQDSSDKKKQEAAKKAQEAADKAKEAADKAKEAEQNGDLDSAEKAANKASKEMQNAVDNANDAINKSADEYAEDAKKYAEETQKAADEAQKAASNPNATENTKNAAKEAQELAKEAKKAADNAQKAAEKGNKDKAKSEAAKALSLKEQTVALKSRANQNAENTEDTESNTEEQEKNNSFSSGRNRTETNKAIIEHASRHAKEVCEKYKNHVNESLSTFINKCKASEKMKPNGLILASTLKGSASWNKEVINMSKQFVNQKLKSLKEYKRSYNRIRRGERAFTSADMGKRILIPGREEIKNKIGFDVAVYIDVSGSMSPMIDSVFDTAYSILDNLKKSFGAEQNVDRNKIKMKVFVFDTSMKEIKYGQKVPANGGNYDFDLLFEDILKRESDAFVNIVITDGQFNIPVSKIVNLMTNKMNGLFINVVNNDYNKEQLNEIQKQCASKAQGKFKVVYASPTFKI